MDWAQMEAAHAEFNMPDHPASDLFTCFARGGEVLVRERQPGIGSVEHGPFASGIAAVAFVANHIRQSNPVTI